MGEPSLTLCPITWQEAVAFVEKHHRHHAPPQGWKFGVGVARDDTEEVVGVAMVGRPVSRHLDDGWTLEVTRVATDGTPNACSKLYAACWRAAKAIGYRRLITYTLPNESGASLRGAGWSCIGERGGGSWSRTGRPRVDTHPTQVKLRWEVS